ncbi:site-specific integrase [Bradyrhizobium sp. BR 10289]|uniref:tyrosine-type recombinase/integrase n=1 Tax=Bradyrhizobium sp. BR 10289 TaxID=2749993 RepID=UPI001C64F3E8|nr:site-specific integrase [Bradyrhizobium sp. BR 10289]MBW7973550.1 site-specific integrase [Bradyrhizobium sp. BR 10289]
MSVYLQPGCTIYQIDFWYRRKRYCKSSGCTSYAAAKREEKKWKAQLREASLLPSYARPKGGKTFHEVRKDYFDLHGKRTTNSQSLEVQLQVAENIVGKDTPVCEITDHLMLQFRKRFEELPSDRTRTPGKRQNSSINDFMRLINRMVNYTIDIIKEKIERLNPDKWLLPEPWKMRELSAAEESRLAEVSKPEIRRLWQFIIETGLRRKPACGLKWDQVDEDARKVTVTEKGQKPHVVPLSDYALELLKEVKGQHPSFVFTLVAKRNCNGKHTSYREGDRIEIKPGYFWKRFDADLVLARIDDFTVHDLRHTAATRLLRVCGNIAIVQRFLGHTTDKETRRYLHMVQEDVAAAVLMRDIARLRSNIAVVSELDALPSFPAAVNLRHIHLALNLRDQLQHRLANLRRAAA